MALVNTAPGEVLIAAVNNDDSGTYDDSEDSESVGDRPDLD